MPTMRNATLTNPTQRRLILRCCAAAEAFFSSINLVRREKRSFGTTSKTLVPRKPGPGRKPSGKTRQGATSGILFCPGPFRNSSAEKGEKGGPGPPDAKIDAP